MVVIGSFGFVENSGASFEEVGLEECKDRRANNFRRKYSTGNEMGTAPRRIGKKVEYSPLRPREVDGLNVALVAAFPAGFGSNPKKLELSSNAKPKRWRYRRI